MPSRQASERTAMTIGMSRMSAGSGKKVASAKAKTISHHTAWRCAAFSMVQS
jgi:hypothetical protein